MNSREVGYIRYKLKEEYYPKPKKEEDPAAADAKQEDKFEPFYEGDGNPSSNEPSSDSTSDAPVQAESSGKPKREFKKGGHGKHQRSEGAHA